MKKLNEAKINLKSVLDRLEKSIDKTVENTQNNSSDALIEENKNLNLQLDELNKKLIEKDEEMIYLRESNHKLQAKLGEEQEQNFKLQSKNSQAIKRVNAVIGEVKTYMNEITQH